MPHRKPLTAVVRARVTTEMKRNVQALAAVRGLASDESDVLRDALEWYTSQSEVKGKIAAGMKRLEELEREAGKRGDGRPGYAK